MNLPAPLALSKKDTPRSAPVAALLIGTIKTITKGAKLLPNKQALTSFWNSLNTYALRNLAELEGTAAPAAAAPKAAQPKAKKLKAPESAGQAAGA
jgi:hypothetical protein